MEKQVPLHCLRCRCDMELIDRHVAVEGLDGLVAYRCPLCGKIELFDLATAEEDVRCVECGATITAGQAACPSCGWTWKAPGAAGSRREHASSQ